MVKRWSAICFLVLCTALLATATGAAQRGDNAKLLKQIQATIAKVRDGKTENARFEAADRLWDLTEKINPGAVDDKTLADMISLMNTRDDAVRGSVAAALGNLGPRAKAAVPALLKDIRETECWFEEVTSAGAARLALRRIGVKPPPHADCTGRWVFNPYREKTGTKGSDQPKGASRLMVLQSTIATVRAMKRPSAERTNVAEHLVEITRKIDPKKVGDATLTSLASLLNIPDDAVRARVAASLGNLGPRAKPAAPALLHVLGEVDCRQADLTLAVAIRHALTRIGVTPPPRNCGGKGN